MPTVNELKKRCKELGINGYSKWKKDELLKNCGEGTTSNRKSAKRKSAKRKSAKRKSAKRKSAKRKSDSRPQSASTKPQQSIALVPKQFLNDDVILQLLLTMDINSLENACKTNKQFFRVCKENYKKIIHELMPPFARELLLDIPNQLKLRFCKEYVRAPPKLGKNPLGRLYTKDEFITILINNVEDPSNKINKQAQLNKKAHMACYYNLTAIAEYLISKGANIDGVSNYYDVKRKGDDIYVFEQSWSDSRTVLHYPVLFGEIETVHFIFEQMQGKRFHTNIDLGLTVQEKLYDMLELLLKGGLNPNAIWTGYIPQIPHTFYGNALQLAAKNDDVKAMRLLVQFGGNTYDDALAVAAEFNKLKAVDYLLENCAITKHEFSMEQASRKMYIEAVYKIYKAGGDLRKIRKEFANKVKIAIGIYEDEQKIIEYLQITGPKNYDYDEYSKLLSEKVYKTKDIFKDLTRYAKTIRQSKDFGFIRKDRLHDLKIQKN